MRRIDYQPLVDKVRSRVTSWTVKHLSFAGRLQLLQSELYNIIGFWAAAFPLPQGCLETLEKILNAFLWTGAPTSAKGAKVSWAAVCTPKDCGGLGLRKLSGMNNIFCLKLLWKLFDGTESLWVAWVKKHYLDDRNLWISDFSSRGSWLWRNLMKLRPLARPLILCHLNSGRIASFWHDNWTNIGPLFEITGPTGPRFSGIPFNASVSSAVSQSNWIISRSRNPLLSTLRAALPSSPPDIESINEDYYMWRNSPVDAPSMFCSSKLWNSLYPPPPTVSWFNAVWFKKHIPKHAFIVWLVMKDRMVTRDRLLAWGLDVSPLCLLCGNVNESTSHIFFRCEYASTVWRKTTDRSGLRPPSQIEEIVPWLISSQVAGKLKTILKLLFQATIYHIWKERNSRLHNSTSKPYTSIVKEIFNQLRAKLFSLDKEDQTTQQQMQHSSQQHATYLSYWFQHVQG